MSSYDTDDFNFTRDQQLEADTWTCHICGEERENKYIDVRTYPARGGNIGMLYNVRFCNDRNICINEAIRWAGLGMFPGNKDEKRVSIQQIYGV
jgi:hypothetical protein